MFILSQLTSLNSFVIHSTRAFRSKCENFQGNKMNVSVGHQTRTFAGQIAIMKCQVQNYRMEIFPEQKKNFMKWS